MRQLDAAALQQLLQFVIGYDSISEVAATLTEFLGCQAWAT